MFNTIILHWIIIFLLNYQYLLKYFNANINFLINNFLSALSLKLNILPKCLDVDGQLCYPNKIGGVFMCITYVGVLHV